MVTQVFKDLTFFVGLYILFLVMFSTLTKFVMNHNQTLGFIFEADDGTSDRESEYG